MQAERLLARREQDPDLCRRWVISISSQASASSESSSCRSSITSRAAPRSAPAAQEPLYHHRAREARRRADPLDHVVAGGVGEGVDHVKPEPLRVTLAALDGDPRDSLVGFRGP